MKEKVFLNYLSMVDDLRSGFSRYAEDCGITRKEVRDLVARLKAKRWIYTRKVTVKGVERCQIRITDLGWEVLDGID